MVVPGTDIWDNSHLWEESKQQHNFPEIGFQLVIAVSGSGILCMLGNYSELLPCFFSINLSLTFCGNMMTLFLNIQQTSQLAYQGIGCL